jgi:hypothetical protein
LFGYPGHRGFVTTAAEFVKHVTGGERETRMRRTKLVGIAAAALAMLGGPLAAAPAQAGCVHWTCKTVFETAAFRRISR